MTIRKFALLGAAATLLLLSRTVAMADDLVVGVSWSNFQEERWKRDEGAIKAALEAAGVKYISADAQASNEKQASDIDNLITKGANALIVLAWDADAVLPAVQKAEAQGIPVVAYDRLIQDPQVFYLTFDNVEVGRMQAREVQKVKPEGNYVVIKGASTDPNADFLHQGQQTANFTGRESVAREPVEVIARQVRNDPALVHAKRHLPGDKQFQVLWIHVTRCLGIE